MAKAMGSRMGLLSNACRFFHTTPAAGLKRKPRVIANIDNHEFHKVIKYVRPDELKVYDPRRTLDLRPLETIDPNWLKLEYRPFADILDSLPEDHRRVFTVGFGQRRDGTRILLQDSLDQTKRHKYDNSSLEFKVTWATWKIRNYQDLVKTHPVAAKGSIDKQKIKELIDKRKKWLNRMRHQDYKRFEWILEVLGIMYKLRPVWTRIERKASINVLVNMYCNELRDQKMAEYKAELEKEKVPFLKMKLETLMQIRADEASVGCSSSVDDDIRSTRTMLQQLEKLDPMTVHPVNVSSGEQIAPTSSS